jgi:hypothetical protein
MCIFNNIYIVNTLVMCTNDVNWITDYLFFLISSISLKMQNQAMCIPEVKVVLCQTSKR